jgi:hypothetical protein
MMINSEEWFLDLSCFFLNLDFTFTLLGTSWKPRDRATHQQLPTGNDGTSKTSQYKGLVHVERRHREQGKHCTFLS